MKEHRIVTTANEGETWYKVEEKVKPWIGKHYWTSATCYIYKTLSKAERERENLIFEDNFKPEIKG